MIHNITKLLPYSALTPSEAICKTAVVDQDSTQGSRQYHGFLMETNIYGTMSHSAADELSALWEEIDLAPDNT